MNYKFYYLRHTDKLSLQGSDTAFAYMQLILHRWNESNLNLQLSSCRCSAFPPCANWLWI